MDFWIKFWTIFFFASLTLFAGLAIIVTVGGMFDIRALLKSLKKNSTQSDEV